MIRFGSGSRDWRRSKAGFCLLYTSDLEVVEKIYDFVIGDVKYDKEKADNVKSGYLPDVDETLETKKGICFDYASLMTTMFRSQGIPTKLEIGYTQELKHAWISTYPVSYTHLSLVLFSLFLIFTLLSVLGNTIPVPGGLSQTASSFPPQCDPPEGFLLHRKQSFLCNKKSPYNNCCKGRHTYLRCAVPPLL